MKKIDWQRKLTSRKFWVAVSSMAAGYVIAFGGGDSLAKTVTGLIMSTATVIAYIIGEGMADAANVGSENIETGILLDSESTKEDFPRQEK